MSEEHEIKTIYREKVLERVSSPEQLNNYVRVMNAGVWAVLGAIIALLVGAVIWCSVISLETETVDAAATVKNGEVALYFSSADRSKVSDGMTLHIGEHDFLLPECEIRGVKLFPETDSSVMELLPSADSEYYCCMEFCAELPNGVYDAAVVSSSISPLELLFN